ncbi:methyltransferase, partial [Mycobacterium sp. ITM-2017-0098]
DRTTLHRVWRVILALLASAVAVACFFAPVLLVVIGVLLLLLVCARFVYRRRDRYIPNLYSRDIAVYEDDYQAFVRRTMSDL